MAGNDKKEMWEGGEIGGFDCYVLADDEAAEASDVYKEDPDDDGPLVQTLAKSNTLSIVLQVAPFPAMGVVLNKSTLA